MKKQTKRQLIAVLTSTVICIIGAIIWAFTSMYGYYTSFLSLGITFCAMFVYAKIYIPDIFSYVYITILSCILNVVATFMGIVLTLQSMLDYSVGEVIRLLFELLQQHEEIRWSFITNAFSAIVFTLIGAALAINYLHRMGKNPLRKIKVGMQSGSHSMTTDSSKEDKKIRKQQMKYSKTQPTDINSDSFTIYFDMIQNQFEDEIISFKSHQNAETLKNNLEKLNKKYLEPLNSEQKESYITAINNSLKQSAISDDEILSLNTMKNYLN